MLRLPHQSIPRKSASWCATGTRWPKGSICYNGTQSKNSSDRSQVTARRIWVSTVILKTSPFANFRGIGRNYGPFWVDRCAIFLSGFTRWKSGGRVHQQTLTAVRGLNSREFDNLKIKFIPPLRLAFFLQKKAKIIN